MLRPERSDPRALVGGQPFWPLVNRSSIRYDALSSGADCDVAVVGAGVSGALIAFLLVESGFDVMVVEQGV